MLDVGRGETHQEGRGRPKGCGRLNEEELALRRVQLLVVLRHGLGAPVVPGLCLPRAGMRHAPVLLRVPRCRQPGPVITQMKEERNSRETIRHNQMQQQQDEIDVLKGQIEIKEGQLQVAL